MAAIDIQNAVDAALSGLRDDLGGLSLLDLLAILQAEYFDEHGEYWQGLELSDLPADGESVPPDLLRRAHDVTSSWQDLVPPGAIPAEMMSQPAIDVYRYPDGTHGYDLRCSFSHGGQTYRRVVGSNEHDWEVI